MIQWCYWLYQLLYCSTTANSDASHRRFEPLRLRLLTYLPHCKSTDATSSNQCRDSHILFARNASIFCKPQVSDCAQHPADIKVNTWTQVTCADCSEQTYNGDMPEVECFIPPASTPSPSPPSPSSPSDPPTSGAAPEDDDASAGGSVDEDPSSGAPVDGGDGGFYCAVGVFVGVGVGDCGGIGFGVGVWWLVIVMMVMLELVFRTRY